MRRSSKKNKLRGETTKYSEYILVVCESQAEGSDFKFFGSRRVRKEREREQRGKREKREEKRKEGTYEIRKRANS